MMTNIKAKTNTKIITLIALVFQKMQVKYKISAEDMDEMISILKYIKEIK
jgi:hypothetical protein